MPGGSTTLHEPADQLREETINMHRAIVSLMEELEAVDWYQQRSEACTDAQLRDILRHNMEEEIEHATMTLEWIFTVLIGIAAFAILAVAVTPGTGLG